MSQVKYELMLVGMAQTITAQVWYIQRDYPVKVSCVVMWMCESVISCGSVFVIFQKYTYNWKIDAQRFWWYQSYSFSNIRLTSKPMQQVDLFCYV